MKEEDKIELRSEEVQEILGRPPRWIVRYGISLIFLIVAALFIGSYFFKYPDILQATITVTTENVPAGLTAKVSGRIDSLFVFEKEYIHQGEIVALIENPAYLEDVIDLKNSLDYFTLDDTATFSLPERKLQLGEIQPAYIAFLKAYGDYRYFRDARYHQKMIRVLEQQVHAQNSIVAKIKHQVELARKQMESSRKLFGIDSSLTQKGALSTASLETSRSAYLQQQQAYENAKLNLDNIQLTILQLQQNIFELQQKESEESSAHILNVSGNYEQLMAQIKQWEQSYLLRSPVNGIVTLTKYWQKNQNVTAGEVLVTVVPEEKQKIIGKIILPVQGAGKVKEGQYVNVKFHNFPYMEYGMVRVPITHISMVPIAINERESGYVLEVEFPDKLVTNYGKELAFSQEMQGTAEIITEDLRLIHKFINPIRAIFKK